STSGAYSLQLFVAGDVNADGLVDGRDSQLLMDALGSRAGDDRYLRTADLDRDGTVDATDVQILARNFGFVANQPPVVTPRAVQTHEDLEVGVDLAELVSDPEGDPVFVQVIAAQHGTASEPPGLTR